MAATFLSVRHLTKHFAPNAFSRGPVVRALEDISFDIARGQVVGLVGESGSGKTTLGRSVLRLIEPTSGEISFNGVDIAKLSASQLRRQRCGM
ncbi:ABC transporter ATP-binding protein, partial [bacterium M00.F.Ca.ET.177.01.1.1]